MRKRSFVIFGVIAVFLGVIVPLWAIDSGGSQKVPTVTGEEQASSELVVTFNENCGTCHTLAAAAADGKVGPNLDELLGDSSPDANRARILGAIQNGVAGRMPKGILGGQQAKDLAGFVAQVAGNPAAAR